MAEYGMTDSSLTSVTATPGSGFMPKRRTKPRCALPAPTRTTCFSRGTMAGDAFMKESRAGDFVKVQGNRGIAVAVRAAVELVEVLAAEVVHEITGLADDLAVLEKHLDALASFQSADAGLE